MISNMHADPPAVGDAFGQALLECHENDGRFGVAWEIVERDDGYVGVTDAAHYFAPCDDLPQAEQWAIRRAATVLPGSRVLDIGCGAGRHAVVLRQQGHDVIGLDASPGAVDIMRRRGLRALHCDLETLAAITRGSPGIGLQDGWPQVFLLLGHNLGLLGPHEDQARHMLQGLADMAGPQGASILATGFNPYTTSRACHVAYHQRNHEAGLPGGNIRMRVRHKLLTTNWFDYTQRSLTELHDLLRPTPWQVADSIQYRKSYAVHLTTAG